MNQIDEINEIINSFKELSGVGVCFYDLENFFNYDTDGKRENVGHYCELCSCVKLLSGGREACNVSDRRHAIELAHQYTSPFFFKCHFGLCELLVPIHGDNGLIGAVFLGQCRIAGEDSRGEIVKNAQSLGGDGEKFGRMYDALPALSRSSLLSMGRILRIYFRNLSRTEEFFGESGGASGTDLCQRIAAYVEHNYMHDITPGSISETFFVNQSYLARRFRQSHGCTLTDYIRSVRMERAKKLLLNTSLPVNSIALNVGFPDSNYFTRIFTKWEGKTPLSVRRSGEAEEINT